MCKECEKKATTLLVAPLKIYYDKISDANIKEFCRWFKEEKVDIVTVHFIAEEITITVGLESEVEMLEKLLEPSYAPSRDVKLREALSSLA